MKKGDNKFIFAYVIISVTEFIIKEMLWNYQLFETSLSLKASQVRQKKRVRKGRWPYRKTGRYTLNPFLRDDDRKCKKRSSYM